MELSHSKLIGIVFRPQVGDDWNSNTKQTGRLLQSHQVRGCGVLYTTCMYMYVASAFITIPNVRMHLSTYLYRNNPFHI